MQVYGVVTCIGCKEKGRYLGLDVCGPIVSIVGGEPDIYICEERLPALKVNAELMCR